MKLQFWMNINGIKAKEAAKLFGISHIHIYKYIYAHAIPKPVIMLRIFVVTQGAVSPNDFYNATEEFLTKELLKQLKQRIKSDEM